MKLIGLLLMVVPACAAPAAVIQNAALRVEADPGGIVVTMLASGRAWRQPPQKDARFLSVVPDGARTLSMLVRLGKEQRPGRLTLSLPEQGADLQLTVGLDDPAATISTFTSMDGFALESPDGAVVAAEYAGGHLLPFSEAPIPKRWFSGQTIDLPFVGLVDLKTGAGCLILMQTPDDDAIQLRDARIGDRDWPVPRLIVHPSMGQFRTQRKTLFHFHDSGSYVEQAAWYRQYARKAGLLVTLKEKAAANPNVARLYGAPDVWGGAGLKFAREAKSAGIRRMLLHAELKPDEFAPVHELGYFTSRYDNYTDVFNISEQHPLGSNYDRVPENVVQQADGQRMKAWMEWSGRQFMKRCPARWIDAARAVIPADLRSRPYQGRFIDVTTSEGLYECYDPQHPLTRAQKRAMGNDLLEYTRSLNLVVGGEHGRWWAVPQLTYIEGMMSGGYAAWPAGHLKRPKSREEQFVHPGGGKYPTWEQYDRLGIGHQRRIPLWELVFHDCVISTWYWGDSTDFLLAAAPQYTAKKDAFNILYGTPPMFWANREGGWTTHRDLMLRSYRKTCLLHEAIAQAPMESHEFLTPDRHIQRTRFGDGTVVVVNFGPPAQATTPLGVLLLPTNGFAVKGPGIVQSLAVENGVARLHIEAGDFKHDEALPAEAP